MFLTFLVFFLFFVSGFTGLVYEVLWFRAAGVLFGNTAHAAAAVLASFFAGLLAGSFYWGARSGKTKNLLLTYAVFQTAVGAAAMLFFLLKPLYLAIYARLFPFLSSHGAFLIAFQFLLSCGFVFLPSFFMGGALPLLLEWSARRGLRPERAGTLLYAINTAGAAFGAFVGGFYLLPKFGFQVSYVFVIGLTFFIAAIAFVPLSLQGVPLWRDDDGIASATSGMLSRNDGYSMSTGTEIWILAFVSGFLTLGLEVLWTHMFTQVLYNSVYTFSAVVVTFLIALSAGSILAYLLFRSKPSPRFVLFLLCLTAGICVSMTPFLYHALTQDPNQLWVRGSWTSYVGSVFRLTMLTLLIPVISIGTVFPFLLKWLEKRTADADTPHHVGDFLGRLLAWNALGSIIGSVFSGFFLLKWLGLWQSIRLMAVLYSLLAMFVARRTLRPLLILFPLTGMVLFFTALNPEKLPLIYLSAKEDEKLLQMWEGRYGTVAVVRAGSELKLKANNFFGLGGTGFQHSRITMADLPILLHPEAKSVYFLGMGTGITAARSLAHPLIERVVVSELVSEVVEAARIYFSWEHGLFRDPRVRIIVGDGRNYLAANSEMFDLVVGDLFFPWEAGTGSLYTKEHFEVVFKRLKAGGLFAQWLPLYQMTDREFLIIANTMRQVFPLVTLWRGDFLIDRPVAALMGHKEAAPLDPDAFSKRFLRFSGHADLPESVRALIPFAHYGGNLSFIQDLFRNVPTNTDDGSIIEYIAPKSHIEVYSGQRFWLTSVTLARFLEEISRQVPFERDPFLSKLSSEQKNAVQAGLELYVREVARQNNYPKIAEEYLKRICNRLSVKLCDDFRVSLEPQKSE